MFGDFDPDQYEEEVRERWGDTDAYRQSQQRTASYTKEDWQRIRAEGEDEEDADVEVRDLEGPLVLDRRERVALRVRSDRLIDDAVAQLHGAVGRIQTIGDAGCKLAIKASERI